jgi:hypothetical protein
MGDQISIETATALFAEGVYRSTPGYHRAPSAVYAFIAGLVVAGMIVLAAGNW